MTRRTHTQASTSVAVDWDIAEGDDFDVLMLTLTLDAAPTAQENLTVTLDSVLGGAYDSTLVTVDPRGATSIVVTGISGLVKGDVVTVAYANTDTNAIVGTATVDLYQRTFTGDATNPSKIGVYLDGVEQGSDSVKGGDAMPLVIKSQTYSTTTGTQTLFTVTGDVIVRVIPVCKTNLTSAGACNVELGVTGTVAAMIAATDVTTIDADEIWHDATSDSDVEAESVSRNYIISGGADVILTLSAQIDAGAITYYCNWRPLSADGNVVAA